MMVNVLMAANDIVKCRLLPADETMSTQIIKLLKNNNTYLIRYKLQFPDQRPNPLANNLPHVFKTDSYNRVSKKHGQTLLSLAFNYGVISLMTLTFGTSDLKVSVYESPANCLDGLNEDEALNVVLYLLARDFNSTSETVSIHDEQRICLQYIVASEGKAIFKPRCYSADTVDSMSEFQEIGNRWIDGLYVLMAVSKIVLACFGPLLFVGYVASLSQESTPYVVKLKKPLFRTLFVAKSLSDFERVRAERILNLSKCRGYPKLKRTLENTPFGRPFLAKISEYDILAANSRLIQEDEVPFTFWSAIGDAVFRCKMKNVGPMQSCCYVDMFQEIPCIQRKVPWINFWTKVGNALLILFLPFLYYLRLILFYVFERDELVERRASAETLHLTDSFDSSLIHYLHPDHWVFITIYVIYFISAFTLAYLTRSDNEGRFRSIIVGSFADLGRLKYRKVLQLMVENIIWPFKRYGVLGCLVAIVYWPVFLPLTVIVYVFYSIPTMYLTFRMLFYSRRSFLETIRKRSGVRKYQMSTKEDNNLKLFQVDYLFGVRDTSQPTPKLSEFKQEADEMAKFKMTDSAKEKDDDTASVATSIVHSLRIRPGRFFQHLMSSIACILSLYSLLIIVAECLGALVEIAVFTMMGIIVNAGLTVKYAALVTLLIVYSYDCFNNIQMRYFLLNKELFIDLKTRVEEIEDVTSLPSYLQENQAFKTKEHVESGTIEKEDGIAEQLSRHWLINDLVLFVDNEDEFRIPRNLFKQVCEIKVKGVPGPVYKGVLKACSAFLKMLVFVIFVFLVVLSFGDIYELSSSTQVMAILATGFLPVIMRQFMEPKKPHVEINSLGFQSKLDEVIKSFWQLWPIHDFSFTPMPDPDTLADTVNATATTNAQTNVDEKQGVSAEQVTENLITENQITENNVAAETPETESSMSESKTQIPVIADLRVDKILLDVRQSDVAQDPAKTNSNDSQPDTRHSFSKFQKALQNSLSMFNSSRLDDRRSIRSSTSEKLNRSPNNNATIYHVDLLIRLPSRYEDEWVDGWSNIIQIEEVKKKASEVAEEMVEAAAAENDGQTT